MLHVGELITISETKSVAALRGHGSKVLLGTVGDSRFQAHGITMEFEAISNGCSRSLLKVNHIHKSCEQPSKQKRRHRRRLKQVLNWIELLVSDLHQIRNHSSGRSSALQGPFERETSQASIKLSSLSDHIFRSPLRDKPASCASASSCPSFPGIIA